jgi:hypothetical protein
MRPWLVGLDLTLFCVVHAYIGWSLGARGLRGTFLRSSPAEYTGPLLIAGLGTAAGWFLAWLQKTYNFHYQIEHLAVSGACLLVPFLWAQWRRR